MQSCGQYRMAVLAAFRAKRYGFSLHCCRPLPVVLRDGYRKKILPLPAMLLARRRDSILCSIEFVWNKHQHGADLFQGDGFPADPNLDQGGSKWMEEGRVAASKVSHFESDRIVLRRHLLALGWSNGPSRQDGLRVFVSLVT